MRPADCCWLSHCAAHWPTANRLARCQALPQQDAGQRGNSSCRPYQVGRRVQQQIVGHPQGKCRERKCHRRQADPPHRAEQSARVIGQVARHARVVLSANAGTHSSQQQDADDAHGPYQELAFEQRSAVEGGEGKQASGEGAESVGELALPDGPRCASQHLPSCSVHVSTSSKSSKYTASANKPAGSTSGQLPRSSTRVASF